jgi:RNA polymerase sigma-70 factor, ECF subfamily
MARFVAPTSDTSPDGMPTSRSLLQRARQRDSQAWQELVDLYAPLVYYWCRRTNIAVQDIPDVVQDVFRSVVTGLETFRKERPRDTFRGWLRTVTRSKLNDYFRRLQKQPGAAGGSTARARFEEIAHEEVDSDDNERHVESALYQRALQVVRRHFDARTWQAFWRIVVEGRTAAEVAQELGMKPGTVRVAKSRVLQRLRRELGDIE